MRKRFDYKSKKFTIICTGWVLEAIAFIWGTLHGFPEAQAPMAWGYLTTYTAALLTLTGWWFKKDIDEKQLSNGKD